MKWKWNDLSKQLFFVDVRWRLKVILYGHCWIIVRREYLFWVGTCTNDVVWPSVTARWCGGSSTSCWPATWRWTRRRRWGWRRPPCAPRWPPSWRATRRSRTVASSSSTWRRRDSTTTGCASRSTSRRRWSAPTGRPSGRSSRACGRRARPVSGRGGATHLTQRY